LIGPSRHYRARADWNTIERIVVTLNIPSVARWGYRAIREGRSLLPKLGGWGVFGKISTSHAQTRDGPLKSALRCAMPISKDAQRAMGYSLEVPKPGPASTLTDEQAMFWRGAICRLATDLGIGRSRNFAREPADAICRRRVT
jgi:hypothetical protein